MHGIGLALFFSQVFVLSGQREGRSVRFPALVIWICNGCWMLMTPAHEAHKGHDTAPILTLTLSHTRRHMLYPSLQTLYPGYLSSSWACHDAALASVLELAASSRQRDRLNSTQ
jgi:hypothetical protein